MIMKKLSDWKFWERHANYLSGWTRLAAYPLLISSLYLRNWYLLAGVVIFIIVNPILFPKPKKKDYWMSKGVLGEQLWIKNKAKIKKATTMNILNGISFLIMLAAIYYQCLYLTIIAGTASGVFKLLFMEEMVLYYEKSR
jgi:hypothetical protein